MLELYSGDVEEGRSKGGFSGPDERFSWSLNVAWLEDIPCKKVNLKVSWKQKNKKQGLSVLTYI
jgi:hypothetical protein